MGFVYMGLGLALSAGFGVAALLGIHLGSGLLQGSTWLALVQIHGHAQVFGWLGLFIMGVSLYFLPRFSGAPLRYPALSRWIWILLGLGILSRALAQPLMANYGGSFLLFLRWSVALGSVMELAAVLLYTFLLGMSIRGKALASRHRAIRPLRIYFASALIGWLLSAALVSAGALRAAVNGFWLADPLWNGLGLDLFTGLVLVPVAFAFSLRTFPLFLRLPAPRWPVHRFGLIYLCAFGLEILPELWLLAGFPLGLIALPIQPLGQILKGGILVAFVWKLDILFRQRPPWTTERVAAPPNLPRFYPPPRPELPDRGQFGHFERLLYAAYLWLFVAGLLEIYNGANQLTGGPPFASDILRHTYLGGYGSLLLLGMAPRMIPGFVHLRGLAFPILVDLSFYLASTAIFFRVVSAIILEIGILFFLRPASSYLLGFSGLLGWLAVMTLAGNLWLTCGNRPVSVVRSAENKPGGN